MLKICGAQKIYFVYKKFDLDKHCVVERLVWVLSGGRIKKTQNYKLALYFRARLLQELRSE